MSKHTLRPISFAPAYHVSAIGQVFSIESNWRGHGIRELAQQANGYGYPSVRLVINGKRKRFVVHRLVADAFLPARPSEQHEIRHIDGDRANSSKVNLAWGTQKDNADDRERHGRTSRGKRHSEAIKCGILKSKNPFWRHAR